MAAPLIAVDAGHYPEKPGVISASGKPELEYNLALAAEVKRELETAGFGVRLIAQDPSFGRRTREAQGAALFVSLHHDSVREWLLPKAQKFSGYSLFVSRLNPQAEKSLHCASAIGSQMRAIGLKTWVMIPYACDFRWMVEREDIPWYPGMRLFRQKKMDDWGEVIGRIREELRRL